MIHGVLNTMISIVDTVNNQSAPNYHIRPAVIHSIIIIFSNDDDDNTTTPTITIIIMVVRSGSGSGDDDQRYTKSDGKSGK